MDLDTLLERHRRSLMIASAAMSPRERRAHAQFARDYAEQIKAVRDSLGVAPALPGCGT